MMMREEAGTAEYYRLWCERELKYAGMSFEQWYVKMEAKWQKQDYDRYMADLEDEYDREEDDRARRQAIDF